MTKHRIFLTLALVVLSVCFPSGILRCQEKPPDGTTLAPINLDASPSASTVLNTMATPEDWLRLQAEMAKRPDLNPMQGQEFSEYVKAIILRSVYRLRSPLTTTAGGTVNSHDFRIDDSVGQPIQSGEGDGIFFLGYLGHLYATFLFGCPTTSGDYDGDGITDIAVYRPSAASTWLIRQSSGGTVAVLWGINGDIPVPGDYDGDGKTDVAVFRCSTSEWWIRMSSSGSFVVQWGNCGDIPVPADYDGDGITDVGVFNCKTHQWIIKLSATQETMIDYWGNCGDLPVEADYDGDGRADIAVFQCETNTWWIKYSSTGTHFVEWWGACGMQPAPFDYDGDCKADISVWSPRTGKWYLKLSSGVISGSGEFRVDTWGGTLDVPAAADYDGDALADPAFWSPDSATFYLDRSVADRKIVPWGQPGDIPVVNSFSIRAAMDWFGYY
jgi:hypothetical protein